MRGRTRGRWLVGLLLLCVVAWMGLQRLTAASAGPVVEVGFGVGAMAVEPGAHRLFVGSWGAQLNGVSVVDTIGGTRVRQVLPNRGWPVLTVGRRRHRIYATQPDGDLLHILDAATGASLRTIRVGAGAYSAALDEAGGRLYLGILYSRSVKVLDVTTGATVGVITAGPIGSVALDPGTGRGFVPMAGTTHCGRLPIPRTGAVCTFDLRGGRMLRAVPVASQDGYTLIVDKSTHRLFVLTSPDNTLSVLDTHTGALVRTAPVGAVPARMGRAGMALDTRAGRVMISNSADDTLYLLDARSGAVVRAVALGTDAGDLQGAVAVDEGTSRAFVSGRNGTRVVDTRAGTIVRTLPASYQVAVDPGTRHVFLGQGGDPILVDQLTFRVASALHMRTASPRTGPATVTMLTNAD